MKFISMLTLSLFVSLASAHAGTIVDKSTGAQIIFSMNSERTELTVDGVSAGIGVRKIEAKSVASTVQSRVDNRTYGRTPLMPLSHAVYGLDIMADNPALDITLLYVIPGYNIMTVGANAVDAIAFPFRLPVRLVQDSRNKSDLLAVHTAIASDEEIRVRNGQFQRILELVRE